MSIAKSAHRLGLDRGTKRLTLGIGPVQIACRAQRRSTSDAINSSCGVDYTLLSPPLSLPPSPWASWSLYRTSAAATRDVVCKREVHVLLRGA